MINITALKPRDTIQRSLAGLVAVSFVICYGNVIVSLIKQWSTNEVYTHGFLIPLISAYMIWDGRSRWMRTPVKPDLLWGSLVLGAGLAALIIGEFGSLISLQQLSLIVSLTGILLLLLGRARLRAIWFPVAFLIFMIPVWEVATTPMRQPFQQMTASMAAWMLQAAGVPVLHDGLQLRLRNVTLEVAEACSGVNFVVAILAAGLPQAYLLLNSRLMCVFIGVYGIGVALVVNALRVAFIGILSHNRLAGPDVHGPAHVLQGLFVAVIGFVVVTATIHWLARIAGRDKDTSIDPRPDAAAHRGATEIRWATRAALMASVVLLGVPATEAARRATGIESLRMLSTFPSEIAQWQQVSALLPPPSLISSGADEVLMRTYAGPSRHLVQLYVGYFRSQTQSKELVNDQMSVLHERANALELTDADGTITTANEIVHTVEGRTQYTIFWYDLNGQKVSNRYWAKALTIWQSATRGRTNGAVIMLTADVPPDVDPSVVATEARSLAGLTATSLRAYLPH